MSDIKKLVTKRDGSSQEFSVDKLRNRVNQLLEGLETQYMGIDGCINKVVKYAHSGKFRMN
jgi:transcriptional regulator NrdR family protein